MPTKFDLGLNEQIRWIAFDAVGTLLYADPPVTVVYAQTGRKHGSQLSEVEVRARFAAAFRQAELEDFSGSETQLNTDEDREERRWRQIVGSVLDDVSDPERCFQHLFEHFAQPQAWKTYPDVAASLAALKRAGYRLAVASNFDSRLHRICEGLRELLPVELRVVSSLVGFRKPSGRFYEALVEAAGCSPGEMLMVGDDYENDIASARNAGLRAVFLCRDGTPVDEPHVTNLHAFVEVLKQNV